MAGIRAAVVARIHHLELQHGLPCPLAHKVDPASVYWMAERFDRAIAAQLSRIKWWDWPSDTIFARLTEFQSGDVEAFCTRWSNR